jgi:two-component system CheB/CheR fusion protein
VEDAAPSAADIEPVLRYLRSCGHPDFRSYKATTLRRRIERRAGLHGLGGTQAYLALLRASPQEVTLLARELLIGVTAFFRDESVWRSLPEWVLPALRQHRPAGEPFRAWVAGCSTGEEAYSLAMVLEEVMAALEPERRVPVQIFATDLNAEAIDVARRALYPARIAEEVGPERLQRHFVPAGSGWRVAQPVRDSVVFATHDLLTAPPFMRLDLLCCRNVLIYFGASVQHRLFPLFRYCLRPAGLLLLGQSETAAGFDASFETLDARLRLYRRAAPPMQGADSLPAALAAGPAAAPAPHQESPMNDAATPAGRLQAAADRLLLQEFAPPLVLADAQGNILYTSGYIGAYLETPAGRADWNLHAMARGGLREALPDALALTVARGGSLELPELVLQGPRTPQRVHVTVRALTHPPDLAGTVLVTFRDVVTEGLPAPRRRMRRASDRTLDIEIARGRDEMQSLREEMEASKEELQAANEELQSTNEELQSANEELNASREELLAINDELHAVNLELQSRLAELVLAQSDLHNLQTVSEQAVVFLDASLQLRGLTERARALLALRDEDIGLPLAELAGRLGHPALVQQVRDTLRTLAPAEIDCAGPDGPAGRALSVQVRPYLRLDGVISGAVLAWRDGPDA